MLTTGTVLDRYTVLGPLGQGGMASVYRVAHQRLGTTHALKVLHGGSPSLRERLLREGRVQGNLRHSNVVSVTDVVDVDGAPGLVMEFVDGPTLGQLLAATRLTPTEADALIRPVLDGVVAAHRAGLVHRDLKPANILLALEDERLVPKIADFGLAKVLVDADPDAHRTRSGVAMGTPAYMAPEQIRDASRVDARADVFALGCILYELVSGRTAFRGTDSFELLQAVVAGRFEDVRSLVPGLDSDLVDAIHGALVTEPDERIPSAEALREAWCADRSVPADAFDRLLPLCRELVTRPTEEAPAQTWTGSLVDATGESLAPPSTAHTTAPDPPPTVPAHASASAEAASPTRSGLIPLAAFAGVALAAMAGIGWLSSADRSPPEAPPQQRDPGPAVLGLRAVPTLIDTPDDQAALESGWRAFLDADFPTSERMLEAAVAHDPGEPLVWALLAQTRFVQGNVGDGVQAAWTAFSKAETADSPYGELMPHMAAIAVSEGWNGPAAAAYQAHLERYPTDYYARLTPLISEASAPPPDAIARSAYAASIEADSPPPVAHVLFANDRLGRGLWSEAEAAADAGLAKRPTHPGLLDLRGRARLNTGDPQAARADLLQAIQRNPAMLDTRIALAQTALLLDDPELHAELESQLLGSTTPIADQARYATRTAHTLLGLDRRDQAFERMDRVTERARDANAWPTVLLLELEAYELHQVLGERAALAPLLDRIRTTLQAPELDPELRQRHSEMVLIREAMLAASEGKLDAARAGRARLAALPRPNPMSLARVDNALALATGDGESLNPAIYRAPCSGPIRLALDRQSLGLDPGSGIEQAPQDPTCSALGLDQVWLRKAESAVQ